MDVGHGGNVAESWDARLRSRLGEATLDAPLTADVAPAAIALVERFGFAIVASQPCGDDAGEREARSEQLHDFGAALGTPVVQSPREELVEDVKDYSDIDERDDRGYRSGGELAPHSDPPTLIILHCLRAARHGGESSLVNVASIVQRMRATEPGLVEELFAPLPDWRVAGQYGVTEAGPADRPRPVLTEHEGRLSCVLYRPYIERAADAVGPALTATQIGALDLFESCSTADDLTLRFVLQPGHTLVLHNRAVLHARTDYVDWPDLDRRRHLLRMWIDAPQHFPVHPAHELGDFFAPLG